jgi:cytochrome c biogenesis protein CcmG, thiol:disulfide interchange protein DsbE
VKYKKLFLLIGGLGIGFLLGGLILWFGTPRLENPLTVGKSLPKIGAQIPDFKVTDLKGNKVTGNSFQGKPLIINFWATWCAPCKLELPLLQDTAHKYEKNINLIAVDSDETGEVVKKYVAQNNYNLPVMMDESGEMSNAFGVHAFPVTFFIDEKGILQSIHIGQLDEKLIATYLNSIGITE